MNALANNFNLKYTWYFDIDFDLILYFFKIFKQVNIST